MSELRIEILNESASHRLSELELLCFSVPWSENSLRSALLDELHLWLGCFDGDELIGYVGVQTVLDEGYIDNVAVHPNWRKRGAGRLLINELCRRCAQKGVSSLMLEVRPSNTPARTLYEAAGFEQVGFRPVYYDNPKEGAILMTKYLRAGEENVDTRS